MQTPNQYLCDERGWSLSCQRLYSLLGISGTKMPADFWQGSVMIGNVRVWILTSTDAAKRAGHKNRPHRVLCECPDCGTVVPTGRLWQHRAATKGHLGYIGPRGKLNATPYTKG